MAHPLIIHRSSGNSVFWFYNGTDDGVVLFHGSFATRPTSIVIVNQVMYRVIEAWPKPSRWPMDFQTSIISCSLLNSQLNRMRNISLSPYNWRLASLLVFNME